VGPGIGSTDLQPVGRRSTARSKIGKCPAILARHISPGPSPAFLGTNKARAEFRNGFPAAGFEQRH